MPQLDVVDVQRAVTGFIVDNFLFGNTAEAPAPTTSFMETGLIDSTGVLELVTFIEERYAIKVGDDELVPENLDSVANLAGFVVRKAGA
ncbi:MAG: acyl carrier protein [Kofleriaceae bacterium]|nr:acyl carrier protein [Kofleriaceae bacterium]MCL4226639.1 acyl carrier protein [Myxococcales bacterium]